MSFKQKKSIEWTEAVINPITGCLGPGGRRCEFCYAHRFAVRFKGVHGYPEEDPFSPAWHPERLEQVYNRKKPTVYFFGSMCDHLDDGVKPEWRQVAYEVMKDNEQHLFITLTKRYENLWEIEYDSPKQRIPENVIVGISVNKRNQAWGIDKLREVRTHCRMISFEPLLEDVANIVDLKDIQWVIIGAQTRQSRVGDLPAVPEIQPDPNWIKRLVDKARNAKANIFIKPNVKKYPPETEFPFRLNSGKTGFIYTNFTEGY